MEQLIELLKQIQDLAGVAVDALQKAGGEGGKPPAEHGGPPPEGGGKPPAEHGGPPPEGGGAPHEGMHGGGGQPQYKEKQPA